MNTNVIGKYRKTPVPVKATLWYTICNILNKGFALLATPIFTRVMTGEQYGTFSIFQSWCGIIIIFTSLNIFLGGYQKGLILYKNDLERFTSSQLALTSLITLIYLALYLLNIDFWTRVLELSPVLMAAMFAELMLVPALEFWSARKRFDYKYKEYVTLSILMSAMNLTIGVIAVLNTEYKVEARAISDAFSKCVISGILFAAIFIKGKKLYVREYWIYALKFNIPLIPHYLSNYVLGQSDRIMISRMIGNTQAAFYSVAYTISTMMLLITQAINNSLTPYIYRCLDEDTCSKIREVTKPLIIMVSCMCIVTMAFAPEVIYVFAGADYMDAIYVIPPIAASVYFIFLYSLFSNVEYFYQKTVSIAIATCISACANLLLNFIFIKAFGYYAAGYTTLVCYMLLAVMHYCFYKKILRDKRFLEGIYDINYILISSIVTILIMIAMTFTYKNIVIRYMFIFALILIFVINRKKLITVMNELKKG